MSQITTHVLDTAIGKPAEGIDLTLSQLVDNEWQLLGAGITDNDGRVAKLLADEIKLEAGRYKVLFVTEAYFKKQKVDAFYPYAEIVFDITGDGEHYHIPLLLSPFGYSTYRGS
ncbi:hydroxyisourate hydrolase [uncultured Cocleimonas sp.]|uniref:hydroxyisourate hydrolase n=1 Tax=uncultured Cocleimonas sp. TaxID=1051587 RepID=UPI002615F2A9|nr:hydroxyisourate hydrolase [uncultured Cocleimonas sp.]